MIKVHEARRSRTQLHTSEGITIVSIFRPRQIKQQARNTHSGAIARDTLRNEITRIASIRNELVLRIS